MKLAMADGCQLHVESHGRGGPPIVFLHGIMMSGAVFKRQVEALSADRQIITVDLRGFGQSDKPAEGYATDAYVADLKEAIERLGLERPIIAGWSMGGSVALAFAAAFPGVASRLVLIGSTPCLIQRPDWPHAIPPAAAEQLAGLFAADYSAGAGAFCGMMFPEPDSESDADFVRRIMLATPPHVTLACMMNLGGDDLRDRLPAIREPTSVICGAEDRICPPEASQFLASALGGSLAIIPGGGHCAFLTKPQEFNDVLRAAIS